MPRLCGREEDPALMEPTPASRALDTLAEQLSKGEPKTIGAAVLDAFAGLTGVECAYLALGVLDLLRARKNVAGVVSVLRAIRGGL